MLHATRARSQMHATATAVLAGISISHLLNDTIQAGLPAIYPMLKSAFALTVGQVGLMTLTLQVTASLLQPVVGFLNDLRPTPNSLVLGLGLVITDLLLLSAAP